MMMGGILGGGVRTEVKEVPPRHVYLLLPVDGKIVDGDPIRAVCKDMRSALLWQQECGGGRIIRRELR